MLKLLLVITACLVDVSIQFEWVSATNGIPDTALESLTGVYYCEVDDGGKRTGTTYDDVCEYVKDDTAKSSTTFTVLDNPDNTEVMWRYGNTPPSGAIQCNEGSSCYVGMSTYADGICVEYAGKIIGRKVLMVKNGRVLPSCTLKTYLIPK